MGIKTKYSYETKLSAVQAYEQNQEKPDCMSPMEYHNQLAA